MKMQAPDVAPCRGPAIENQAAGFAKLATGQQVVQCHVDGEPCCILAELVTADALEEVHRALPCERCRLGMAQVRELARVRLGKREREVLLKAAEAGDDGWTPFEAVPSRPQREAYLRAIRKLHEVGLVSPRNQKLRGKVADGYCDGRPYRAARLTPLGCAIVAEYRRELSTGERIRWGARASKAAEASVLPTAALVDIFRRNVRRRLECAMWGMTLIVAVGRNMAAGAEQRQKIRRCEEVLAALQPEEGKPP